MKNRTETRFASLGLPNGFRFGYYPDLATVQADLGESFADKMLIIINKQLAAHVTGSWARDQFTTDLERVSGFAYKTKEKTLKTGRTVNVADETPGEYVDRFRVACKAGITFTPAADLGKLVGRVEDQDDEVTIAEQLNNLVAAPHTKDENEINNWLGQLADLREYSLDAREKERTTKEKGLPKYALEGAEAIYAGNAAKGRDCQANWSHWGKIMAKNNITLPVYSGNKDIDIKILARCIVANESAETKNKYK